MNHHVEVYRLSALHDALETTNEKRSRSLALNRLNTNKCVAHKKIPGEPGIFISLNSA